MIFYNFLENLLFWIGHGPSLQGTAALARRSHHFPRHPAPHPPKGLLVVIYFIVEQ
jgi:hypothetical protein